jgi:glycosyltransferase involved in cell wall biosynthesis
MTTSCKLPLVVDVGPLRETYYTGIPNVVAEICDRLLLEEDIEVYFDLDGRWVETDSIRLCLTERSGKSLSGLMDSFRPAQEIRWKLEKSGMWAQSVALYSDHRPPHKIYPREGKLVYDLSMILAPECHPAASVKMYTHNLREQIFCSDILFCISQSTARDVSWIYGVEPERIKVALLGNNVDLTMPDRIRELIGERQVEPFLLVLGSIEPRKNVPMVLEWLSEYPEILNEVRVVFAGRQAWGESFQAMIERKALGSALASGRIVYTGYVDDRLRAALMTGATALLYPSMFEGFGLPLLEAMAIGTPVLSSVSTSMPEVLGDCGYYFDPYSVSTLHASYRRLQEDRASGALRTIVEKARARANEFSYDKTYDIIIDGLFPDRRSNSP